MNWIAPTPQKHPPFKQIVLGLKRPNSIRLVKLDRIDENGPVFVDAESVTETANSIFGNVFTLSNQVNIDLYCIIELPKEEEKEDDK